MSYKNYITNTQKYIKIKEIFERIKLVDPMFKDISLQIYTEYFDPTINGYIYGNTIYLYPALFISSLNKNNFDIKIEHIIAIIGHELGHYIFKHQYDNPILHEEIEADKYSKMILNKLNMNENSMCEILKIILNNKNFLDDKLITRINELSK